MTDPDPTDLEAQDRARLDREKRVAADEKSEGEEIKWLMGRRLGRRIVWRQLSRAGVFRSSFNNSALVMAFHEGERNAGLRTLGLIHEHCPQLYATMVTENATTDVGN